MASEESRRQFVNFVFFKADPAWRRLPPKERERSKAQFCQVATEWGHSGRMNVLSYTTVGMRADVDFMLWRVCYHLEELQEMTTALLATELGHYLTTPYSYLAMTRRSTYVIEHQHEGQLDSRGQIVPGQYKYLFVYPFVKTRQWYRMSLPARQGMMNEHITIGHKYPLVKLNTTYSFGLDDQDFVVAFESDHPDNFLDLVMELRESEASLYTVRDTPIFTCILKDIKSTLDTLGG
ncbi:MAG: chlorite dismutase [Acidobacteria bacterium RIFCSPLOWO2_12_FULL_59_11]|nr:MAG: chlorite dismutase [Acidobacteria bacterium RIFCSPLOWO2_12_FULL_59_11]